MARARGAGIGRRPARATARSPRPRRRRRTLTLALSRKRERGPGSATAPVAPGKDDEGPPRFSLPTQSDRDAWLRGGFRLSLGLTYGRLAGLEGVPSGGCSARPCASACASTPTGRCSRRFNTTTRRTPAGFRRSASRARSIPPGTRPGTSHSRSASASGDHRGREQQTRRRPAPRRNRHLVHVPQRVAAAAGLQRRGGGGTGARGVDVRARAANVDGPGPGGARSVDRLRERHRARRARQRAGDRAATVLAPRRRHRDVELHVGAQRGPVLSPHDRLPAVRIDAPGGSRSRSTDRAPPGPVPSRFAARAPNLHSARAGRDSPTPLQSGSAGDPLGNVYEVSIASGSGSTWGLCPSLDNPAEAEAERE